MPLTRAAVLNIVLGFGLIACSDQTGLLFEVQGPASETSIEAGISELQLIMARPSYCERWVTDTSAEVLRFSVAARDLSIDPTTILVTPDRVTDLTQAVRATVLARDASGQLLGLASFDAVPFHEGEVRRYPQRVALLGRGSRADGPRYLADDGCLCVPGRPSIGTSSGTGCDPLLPPSYDRLVSTAGCELPAGAELPIGVCDGQLYPGERANRDSPCYVARASGCRIGQRVCNDQGGRAFDKECNSAEATPVLPSGALCDAFAACEQASCSDPVTCLRKTAAIGHVKLRCTLPISPEPNDGVAKPCGSGRWVATVGSQTGAACIGAMLDGTRLGAFTIGFQQDKATMATFGATSCPPTLRVDKIDTTNPSKLPLAVPFSFTLDDHIYDVTLVPQVGCDHGVDSTDNDMQCTVL